MPYINIFFSITNLLNNKKYILKINITIIIFIFKSLNSTV